MVVTRLHLVMKQHGLQVLQQYKEGRQSKEAVEGGSQKREATRPEGLLQQQLTKQRRVEEEAELLFSKTWFKRQR